MIHKPNAWVLSLCVAISFALAPRPATAANEPTTAPATSVTQLYPVQDLLMIVKNYPLHMLVQPTQIRGSAPAPTPASPPATLVLSETALSHSAAPTPTPASPPATQPGPSLEEDALRRFVMDMVDPTSWLDNGGSIGSMGVMNGDLFITQTPANHAAIARLLADLRKTASTMVRIHADWVWLAPGELGTILAAGSADKSPTPVVNRASTPFTKGAVAYSADISCFNGQTVHVASGRARNLTTAANAVVASNVVGYEPTSEIVQCGAALQVTPVLSGDMVTVDLMSEVSNWNEPLDPKAVPAASGVDRFEATIQHFHTTVQVPANVPVLIGGMTFNPTDGGSSNQQLYLVIEADARK